MDKLKKIFNPKYIIGLLIIVVVVSSYTHSFNINLDKDPSKLIKKSIFKTKEELISTNSDFIPSIDMDKLNYSIMREGSFSSYLDLSLNENINNNTYKIKRDFKRNYTSQKSQSDILIEKNSLEPLSINSKLMYNNAYLDINSVYNKTLEIDLSHFGEKLYNSNLISKEQKESMSKKEINTMKNSKFNLFVYPGTFSELEEYFLSFVDYNINEILNNENINVLEATKEYKDILKDDTIKKYNLKFSYFDFKYLLLGTLNAYENLIMNYNNSYNLNLNLDLIHSELRNLSERILKKYDENGIIDADFYINKDKKLLGLFVTKSVNNESEKVLELYLTGKNNTTDSIKLNIHNFKNNEIEYFRNLEIKDTNKIYSKLIINNKEYLNSVHEYNNSNKNLDLNISLLNKNNEISINSSGVLSNIKKDSFDYTINLIEILTNNKNYNINGDLKLSLGKPDIAVPKDTVDIFTLSNSEFMKIKNSTIDLLNNNIPIKSFKSRIPCWNIFTKAFI